MHRQSYVTVPIKVIIEGSLMKRGSTILTAKNLWFFFLSWLNQWYKWLVLNLAHILHEYGFRTLNAASGSALKRISSHFVLTHKSWSSKPFHNVTKEDVKERLAVIWRGVTDDWPTHSSMFTSVLLWQIRPIDSPQPPGILFAIEQQSVGCLNHTDMMGFQNSIHSLREGKSPLWCSTPRVFFYCRSVVIRVLPMMFYCGYFSILRQQLSYWIQIYNFLCHKHTKSSEFITLQRRIHCSTQQIQETEIEILWLKTEVQTGKRGSNSRLYQVFTQKLDLKGNGQ